MASKNELTKLYVEIRDRIAARKAIFDKADGDDKTLLRKIELVLMTKMDEEGEESFRTEFGTAFITTTDYANVAQWDTFLDFIKNNDAFDMLERRCSKTAVREYIKSSKTPPPGINYGARRELAIRRPTKRKAKGEGPEDEAHEDAATESITE